MIDLKISTTILLLVVAYFLFSCNEKKPEIAKKDTTLSNIYNDILLANMISVTEASAKVSLGNFYLETGDTIAVSEGNLRTYVYLTDSTQGDYLEIDSTFHLIYLYKIKYHRFVFGIYNGKNQFIGKALIFRDDFLRYMFEEPEHEKADFYDAYFQKIDEEYDKIQRKYSVSRKYLDSLVGMRTPSRL